MQRDALYVQPFIMRKLRGLLGENETILENNLHTKYVFLIFKKIYFYSVFDVRNIKKNKNNYFLFIYHEC